MFPKNSGYEYSDARCFLLKVNHPGYEYIKGNSTMKTRDTFLEVMLEEGRYYYVSEIDWIEATSE